MSSPTDRLSAALADRHHIDRELGAGGMATVYLAEDLKHDRKVAIKVLKPELAAVLGAERFVVEIKTTAALSHPHILPLFDSGTADGFLYYVMPFIKGETIREKLNRETQFGVDEAVRVAREVADALDYAHRNGVIHRDIKPENILLHDGRAMVMDFGIALAVSAAAGGRMTETGLSLGTPHYMSPEQATADKQITNRSDVYSLASVLFEMLTGEPPHMGTSAQQIIMKIIADTPRPVTELRKAVPPNVAAALAKALEKLPADRFESARAFADALASPAFSITGTRTGSVRGAPTGRRSTILPWSVAAVATAVAIVLAVRPREPGAATAPQVFATLDVENIGLSSANGSLFSVSPNGRHVAIAVQRDGNVGLAIRSLDSMNVRFVQRTAGALHPFWSPDSKSIGFFANDSLKTVDLASETVRAVCVAPRANGGSWSPDDIVIFGTPRGLNRGTATGGTCEVLIPDVRDGTRVLQPYFLADGRHFIATGDQRVWLGDLERPDSLVALRDLVRSEAVLVVPDILVWRGTDALLAQRIDVKAKRLVGEPVRVLPRTRNPGGHSAFSASTNGVVVASFVESSEEAPDGSQVGIADRGGTTLLVRPIPPGVWGGLRLSRNGTRLALGGWNIQTMEVASGRWQRVAGSAEAGRETSSRPIWSPNDSAILYVQAFAPPALRQVSTSSGITRTVRELPFRQREAGLPGTNAITDWSPDGRRITVTGGNAIWEYDFGTDSARQLFTIEGGFSEVRYHPAGGWLAYSMMVEGKTEVFVRPYPGAGEAKRVSSDGGQWPRWNARGTELFYVDARENVVGVPVINSSLLSFGEPGVVVPAAAFAPRHPTEFEVSPDGRRFYFVVSSDSRSLDLVLNWRPLIP